MRTLYSVALLALCLTVFAGCAADSGPVGVSALPTDPGMAIQAADSCCQPNDGSPCAAEKTCEREWEQDER